MTSSDDISAKWWVGGNTPRFVTVFGPPTHHYQKQPEMPHPQPSRLRDQTMHPRLRIAVKKIKSLLFVSSEVECVFG